MFSRPARRVAEPAQTPIERAQTMTRVIIVVEGGVVQAVHADGDLDVSILDLDDHKVETLSERFIAGEVLLAEIRELPEVAVMGCAVNGPGEAREADIGVAVGKTSGLFFRKGKVVKSAPHNKCAALILKEIQKSSKSIKR